MPAHAQCKCQREPSYVRGFWKLMAIVTVVILVAYFTVPYWPI